MRVYSYVIRRYNIIRIKMLTRLALVSYDNASLSLSYFPICNQLPLNFILKNGIMNKETR